MSPERMEEIKYLARRLVWLLTDKQDEEPVQECDQTEAHKYLDKTMYRTDTIFRLDSEQCEHEWVELTSDLRAICGKCGAFN